MLQLFAVFVVSILLASALVGVARLSNRRYTTPGTADVENSYMSAVSTLYGIFVAFMIFTVWTRYYAAMESITTEANTVAEIHRMAGGLNEPMRTNLRRLSLRYAKSVVHDEWQTMKHGKPSPKTEVIVLQMWALYNRMSRDVGDQVLRDHLLTSWTQLADLRRMRLLWSSTGLSYYAYVVLFVGAVLTVGLAAFFTIDNLRLHLMKAASVAAIIALMVATVWGLGHPFRGEIGLQPYAFHEVIGMLSQKQP